MSKSSPPTPDYTQAAQAQGQSSQNVTEQQTVANRPDMTTPFGSETWKETPTYDPTTKQTYENWTGNVSLTPAEQQALTAQQGVQAGQSKLAQSLLPEEYAQEGQGYSNVGPMAATPGATTTAGTIPNPQQFDQQASDAAMNEFNTYNQPLMQQAQSQLDTQLRNQGLDPTDQAYKTAMSNLMNSQNMQTSQAEQQAVLTGAQIGGQQAQTALAGQGQEFGQELGAAQYQDTAAQQQLAQDMQEQGFTLNQIQGILSGQQVGMPSMPGFSSAGAAQGNQALSAAENQGQAELNSFNAQQQQTASAEQGVGELGLAAMAFY